MKISHLLITFLIFITGIAQNGKILSQTHVDLSKTPIWNTITKEGKLTPEFEHLNKLNFYFITYQSDSLKVNGILIEPKKEEKHPVIIYNRGGNREFGKLTIGTLILYTSKIAAEGYVILASNYRSKDEFGGSDLNDVLNLIETSKEIKKADHNNIGMFGWSRGGMMTYLALKNSDKIKTGVIGNGPTDLFGLIADRPEMETNVIAQCIPNYHLNKDKELKNRSAIYWADKLNRDSSLLILCGTNDINVNPIQADQIAEKLSKINYQFELKKIKTDHSFSDKLPEMNEMVIKWFNQKLKLIN